ncbi:hypothetical protein OROGR_019744 [Orobanche gracilis]
MATTSSNMSGSPIADAESSAVVATAAATAAAAAATTAATYVAVDAESSAAAATAATVVAVAAAVAAEVVAAASVAVDAAVEDIVVVVAASATAGAAAGNQQGPYSMGELSMGGYSYQILVTYLREIHTEVPAGLDPSYHFYGNIYAIMIWACEAIHSLGSKCGTILGASFIQRPRYCIEVLSLNSEEEQEQYRSYRPHSPFSSTVVRKRRDLDEEAYCRWLDSDESHLDAYMGILQFDPAFVGVRWLDDWAHQTVLVHTSFLATSTFIASDHFGAIIALGGSVDHLEYVSRVLVQTLGSSPHSFRGEYHLHARFFGAGTKGMIEVKRSTVNGIDDATSCGAFAIRTLESLIKGSFSHGKTETDIYAFRGRMARAIWRFSDDVDSVVCDLTSLFIRVDYVD